MKFCLDATFVKPDEKKKISNAIILFHGYGGDGNDISTLILNWKRFLPNTIFISPNGHEPCSINPSGYQWFDLTQDDPKYILEQSLKAEKKINIFLDEIKKKYNLSNNKICLLGFSQGCMMSINLGLTSDESYSCVVGFSGKIIDRENLKIRKKNNSNILLIHGDQDDIVSSTHLLEAKDFFIRNNVNIETHLIKNCGHHIPIEASSLALNYILKKFNYC